MTSRAGMMGMGEVGMTMGGVRGEAGGRVRLATVASRVMCLRRWKPDKEKDGSDGDFPAAADPKQRDVTPLRLFSLRKPMPEPQWR